MTKQLGGLKNEVGKTLQARGGFGKNNGEDQLPHISNIIRSYIYSDRKDIDA